MRFSTIDFVAPALTYKASVFPDIIAPCLTPSKQMRNVFLMYMLERICVLIEEVIIYLKLGSHFFIEEAVNEDFIHCHKVHSYYIGGKKFTSISFLISITSYDACHCFVRLTSVQNVFLPVDF